MRTYPTIESINLSSSVVHVVMGSNLIINVNVTLSLYAIKKKLSGDLVFRGACCLIITASTEGVRTVQIVLKYTVL